MCKVALVFHVWQHHVSQKMSLVYDIGNLTYKKICVVLQGFQQKYAPLQGEIDNVNDQANELQAAGVNLSHVNTRRIEDFNTRSVYLKI